jgi:putative thioredoxin
MIIDVTDATFQSEVIERSATTPVVVDLWAPWCGPCKTLGPILETVIGETDGKVVLAKVNVDESPQTSTVFRVQGIPAVYAVKDRAVVDGFVGAQGEAFVRDFVAKLLPSEQESEIDRLVAAGDEESLRAALEIDPGHVGAVTGLAELLVERGDTDPALELLERIPESPDTRRIAALARTQGEVGDDIERKLDDLLDQVKGDEEARRKFLDLLELLGPDHPRTAGYRKALTSRLF